MRRARCKAAGRLPTVKLIFPNVELRLDVATAKSGFVNLHLFVDQEDPQHIEELRRLLSRLQFNVMRDRFDCTRAELIRLGKKGVGFRHRRPMSGIYSILWTVQTAEVDKYRLLLPKQTSREAANISLSANSRYGVRILTMNEADLKAPPG
jgi:hypothetical protein